MRLGRALSRSLGCLLRASCSPDPIKAWLVPSVSAAKSSSVRIVRNRRSLTEHLAAGRTQEKPPREPFDLISSF
jgi:hypothetical protein